MATEHPWIFTRTYEDGIPEGAGEDRILDIDLSDRVWKVEAFKYNKIEGTLIVRRSKSKDEFWIDIFEQPEQNDYNQLRKLGQNGDSDKFHQWFKDNIVARELGTGDRITAVAGRVQRQHSSS